MSSCCFFFVCLFEFLADLLYNEMVLLEADKPRSQGILMISPSLKKSFHFSQFVKKAGALPSLRGQFPAVSSCRGVAVWGLVNHRRGEPAHLAACSCPFSAQTCTHPFWKVEGWHSMLPLLLTAWPSSGGSQGPAPAAARIRPSSSTHLSLH